MARPLAVAYSQDYRGFDSDIDPFDANTSKSQIKKLGESLKGLVREHAHGVAASYFAE